MVWVFCFISQAYLLQTKGLALQVVIGSVLGLYIQPQVGTRTRKERYKYWSGFIIVGVLFLSGPQLKEKNQKKSIAQKQVSSLRGILYSFASLSHNLKGFILFDLKVSRSVYSFLHYRSVSHNLLLSYWHSFACLLLFLRFAQS